MHVSIDGLGRIIRGSRLDFKQSFVQATVSRVSSRAIVVTGKAWDVLNVPCNHKFVFSFFL